MAANPNFKVNKFKRFLAQTFRPLIKLGGKRFYVSLEYRYMTGRKLNWKNPTRYTEKLQYLRLYHYPENRAVINATSRVSARTRVAAANYTDILIPLLGIYHRVEDIDFAKLPERFVIKATHACALNYLCTDKSTLNIPALTKTLKRWLTTDYGYETIEPHYSKIKPGFIIEEYLGPSDELPLEYKIHVFNGKARYLYVVSGRKSEIHYDNFHIDFTPFSEAQFNMWSSSALPPKKPAQFTKMVEIAETLAHDFLFCRVDFFVVNDEIYFNEFTFTPAKGTLVFADDNADYLIGEWLDISSAMSR